jgi:RimJ/RimL family protein N-acetyltransferase
MRDTTKWLAAECLITPRLRLEPLSVQHADEAVTVFDDPQLYTFIGGEPLSLAEFRDRYTRQVAGHSPDGSQGWLNWMLRLRTGGELAGTAQATLSRLDQDGAERVAELAWMVAVQHQGQGYATEAASAVMHWLQHHGIDRFQAHIHPGHTASARVAEHIGMHPTGTKVNGEVRWIA